MNTAENIKVDKIVNSILRKIAYEIDISGISIVELSKITGLHVKTISHIKNRKNIPRIDTLLRLCSALDIELYIKDKQHK